MISCVLPIVSTTRWEFPISVFTISPILPLAVSDCSASFCISDATTAKPFPASPARAASMLAFKERRFVWDAISEINCDAFWILCAEIFVCFVCSAIVATAAFTSSLIRFSSSIVTTAASLDCFIWSALSFSSSAALPVSMIRFPIYFTLSEAFFASSACKFAPVVIESTVASTSRIPS